MTNAELATRIDLPQLRWGVKIPLRDGIELCATLYLPDGEVAPAPTICLMTPYIAQTYHKQGLFLARAGYPFLAIDVRGRGNSEGTFTPNINEASDAADVIRWIAAQNFCDGRVTMWGGSYSGYVQWAAVRDCPSPLATIVPVASPFMGVDFPGRGNIYTPYLLQWLTLVWGRTSQDRLFWNNESYWSERFRRWYESGASFAALDDALGAPSPIFQQWLEHPHPDAYWDAYNPTAEDYADIIIPILTITGAYDGDQPGALHHYRQHLTHGGAAAAASHYLLIGPWDHAGTREPAAHFAGLTIGSAGLVDMLQLHVDWYDWVLRGGDRPGLLEDKVTYYVMGAERWRHAPSLEAVTAHHLPLYLHGARNPDRLSRSGSLLTHGSPAGQDHYRYDPSDTRLAALEADIDPTCRSDDRMVAAADGRQLVYESAPFDEPTEIAGFFRLNAWIAIDQPDTDFKVTVYEVAPDQSAIELTSDLMRARYRTDLRSPQPVPTGEVLEYRFEGFPFLARELTPGRRLRLVIAPIASIYSERNNNSGGDVAFETLDQARPVCVTLYRGPQHPSALHVPLAHPEHGHD